MKFKISLIVFMIIFCTLFSISYAAASEVNDTVVSDSENPLIASAVESDNGTFSSLQNKIDSTSSGNTINLERDYKYDDGFDKKGIVIRKDLTINGNGHSIDGLSKSRIFFINHGILKHNNVTLNNITIKNGYSSSYGGAIFNFGDLTVSNCVFENNYANIAGGAINSIGSLNSKNTLFNKNSAKGDAGAVFSLNFEGSAQYFAEYFKTHSADDVKGIVYNLTLSQIFKPMTDYVSNCIFTNNVAKGRGGGAIYAYSHMSISSSKFTSNKANENGGAVFGCKNLFIENSKFTKNQVPKYGGAVYFRGHELTGSYVDGVWVSDIKFYANMIKNSIFTKNVANGRGGAIYGFKSSAAPNVPCAQAVKCTFINNKSPNGKDIYGGTLKNCVVNTKITLKTVKVKKSAKKVVLSATLKKNSSPLKNKQITFKFNGKSYNIKTNSKGIAKLNVKSNVLKKLKVGKTVKYSARYRGLSVIKTAKVYK